VICGQFSRPPQTCYQLNLQLCFQNCCIDLHTCENRWKWCYGLFYGGMFFLKRATSSRSKCRSNVRKIAICSFVLPCILKHLFVIIKFWSYIQHFRLLFCARSHRPPGERIPLLLAVILLLRRGRESCCMTRGI